MASLRRLWMTILLFCALSETISAAPFHVERFRFRESLDPQRLLLLSDSSEATDVLALPPAAWQSSLATARFAKENSWLWLKVTLQNNLQVPTQLTLRLHSGPVASAHFFVLDQNILVEQSHHSGQELDLEQLFHALGPSHTLQLEPGAERTVLISVQVQPPRDVQLELMDATSHQQETFKQLLRWIFVLAILSLLSMGALGLGLKMRSSVPLAFALFNAMTLLFLMRLAHWPFLAFFAAAPTLLLPPLFLVYYAAQASLLFLARRLGADLKPQHGVKKVYWLTQGFLAVYLGLAIVLHQQQSLLFILPCELLLGLVLLTLDRHMRRQQLLQRHLTRLLLGEKLLLLGLYALIAFELLPLACLAEALLWIFMLMHGALFLAILNAVASPASPKSAQTTVPAEPSPLPRPAAKSQLLHENWLHAEKMAALGTFTNGLANELNNPLAIIAGHRFRLSSMIDSRSFNIHEFEKSLTKIDQAINRMIAVIDALKVYAQEPQSQEMMKGFSVRETIKYAIDLCRDKVVSLGITLTTSEMVDASIEGHQGQIIQVLLILVDNAIDALESASEKAIRIELQVTHDTLRLAVIDSGPGVPLGLRSKIWDPFFTSKDPFRHKGLGLSIASGIMSNHRGRLLLDDTTPETRFVLELPRSRPTPTSQPDIKDV